MKISSPPSTGAARGTPAEFVRFLQISRASLMESDTQLWLDKDLGLLNALKDLREHVLRILAMLNGLIRHKSL